MLPLHPVKISEVQVTKYKKLLNEPMGQGKVIKF
jgi:hypothetical protein